MKTPINKSLLSILALGVLSFGVHSVADDFRRGDCNGDSAFDVSEAIFLLGFFFVPGSPAPACEDACDIDDDGTLTLDDAISWLNYLFLASAPPPAPFPSCGDDPTADGLSCSSYDPCGGLSHATAIQPIWDGECSPCHQGSSPAQGLLLVGDAYPNIVNVPSNQLPTMDLITPGVPEDSYLWHKINDTQDTVGGSGGQMPVGPPLDQATIDLITQWILDGADP